jgi:hypothetical protein
LAKSLSTLAIEVFPSVGKPSVTYVERDSGANEKKLALALRSPGQICLLTGPSKTGKTSLYRRVLPTLKRQELIVRCSGRLTPTDFWSSALESLNFERLAESSRTWGINTATKIGLKGEAGWSWLAKVMATVGFTVSASGEYAIAREVVRAGISSKHLIPLLKELPVQLVIEDFHYLSEEVKREVFQQWKAFTDEGVSVLLVSTTHHVIDIAKANRDLTGRTRFIDVGKWDTKDLAQIPEKGFAYLDLKPSAIANRRIAKESVGLPIIAQQICQQILIERDGEPMSRTASKNITSEEVSSAQVVVAEELYTNHQSDYEKLITGPRRKSRKHATYEKILASFALEPLQFSLKHHELVERVEKLKGQDSSIPRASIDSSLRALAKFQARNKIELLEWHEDERVLYILEPSFLFYLRQKLGQPDEHSVAARVLELLSSIEIKSMQFSSPMISFVPDIKKN